MNLHSKAQPSEEREEPAQGSGKGRGWPETAPYLSATVWGAAAT